MAAKMGKAAEEEGQFYQVIRVAVGAFLKGSSPIVAVEFGRRSIPGNIRPSFQELEKACKGRPEQNARRRTGSERGQRYPDCDQEKNVTAGITAAPGRLLTRISSQP